MKSLLLAILLSCAALDVVAEVLDDSQSPRQQLNLVFEWAENRSDLYSLSADQFNRLKARIDNAEVRLNTRNFQGQPVRIFIRLPEQIKGLGNSAGFRLEWQTRGNLLPGYTTPGNRALIFEGLIDTALLVEFFSFTMHLDARQMSGDALLFEPIYEIEAM